MTPSLRLLVKLVYTSSILSLPPSHPLSYLVSERLLTDLVVRGLDAVHSAGVMHQDINPMNIVVNMETKALNIIDLGLASRMPSNEVNIKYKNRKKKK